MSVEAIRWVIDHSKAKGSDYTCLLMIAEHANKDGTGSYPSLSTLARECRVSRRQVIRLVDRLLASGELCVDAGAGAKGANVYSIPMLASDIAMSPLVTPMTGVTHDTSSDAGDTTSDITMSPPASDMHDTTSDIAVAPKPTKAVKSLSRNQEPKPRGEPPFPLVDRYLERLGWERSSADSGWVGKQCRAINTLRSRKGKDGQPVNDDQIWRHVEYLLGQSWRDETPDFSTALGTMAKWLLEGEPERPKSSRNGASDDDPQYRRKAMQKHGNLFQNPPRSD